MTTSKANRELLRRVHKLFDVWMMKTSVRSLLKDKKLLIEVLEVQALLRDALERS